MDIMPAPDMLHPVPLVAQCQQCGEKQVPLRIAGPFLQNEQAVSIWYCPLCSAVPDVAEYVGYVNYDDAALDINERQSGEVSYPVA